MKYITFFLCILLVVSSCSKNSGPVNNDPDDPIDTLPQPPKDTHLVTLGTVSVLRNGLPWIGAFRATFSHKEGTFVFSGKKFVNGLSESFFFDDVPLTPEKNALEFWPSQATMSPDGVPHGAISLVYDGDQGLGGYLLDTTRTDHYIEVLHYDSIAHTVEGRFQVFLRMYDPPSWIPPGIVLPEYAAMTEGKYYLKLED